MISTENKVHLTHSIAFQIMIVLLTALLAILGVGGLFLVYRQTSLIKAQTYESNEASLKQAMFILNNEFNIFGDRLALLATTSFIADLNPVDASRFLKGYNVSPLFIPGEYVALYNGNLEKISDNSMVGSSLPYREFDNFSKVVPQRPYISSLYWEQNTPKKMFAVTVENRATANGYLSASFSFRRLWEKFEKYKVGSEGFFILFDEDGTVLFHPNLRRWLATPHTAEDLGLSGFNAATYKVPPSAYLKFVTGREFLVNYQYDPVYHIGIMSLQPRSEVEALMWSVGYGIAFMGLFVLAVIAFVTAWIVFRVGRPLKKLISRVAIISGGNYDMESEMESGRTDEVYVLSKAFDEMRLTIKGKILELAEHKAHLEMEVLERTRELEKANSQLQQISRTDELTKLPNRRDIREKISYEIYRSERSKKAFSFIFIDIDKFKEFNDTYGHVCGDLVLQTVSQTMRNQLRKHDYVARWGGEEFLAVLPETDLAGAALVAERFRTKVSETVIHFACYEIKVTITIGVSLFDSRLGMDRSIDLADRALYIGKQSGRNRVVVFDPKDITKEDLQAAEMENKITQEVACAIPSVDKPENPSSGK